MFLAKRQVRNICNKLLKWLIYLEIAFQEVISNMIGSAVCVRFFTFTRHCHPYFCITHCTALWLIGISHLNKAVILR